MIATRMRLTRRRSLWMLSAGMARGAESLLANRWREIARTSDGTVGAAALHLGSGEFDALNGDERFPLASVCKLPIAAHMLALVDEGKFKLDQRIEVLAQDVFPGVSEIAERWPKETHFPLTEVLELMVARSDNTAVETFFRVGGGAGAIGARLRQWGIDGIRIDRSEEQISLDAVEARYPPVEQWTGEMFLRLMKQATPEARKGGMNRLLADAGDTGTPNGTVQLLARAFRGELLSKNSTARLVEILKATTTGPKRLKGLLPEGTVVAHKTGTSGSVNGLNAATNDVGVIFLPKGAVAIAVYVKGSRRGEASRERVIAEMGQAAYDRWR